jgi:hypothetical protein
VKVIGAGFGRTGTMSLKVALEELGFGPCYHMIEVIENPEHVEFWEAAWRRLPVDWERFFEDYEATVDWPACTFYEDLIHRYPDAKVLLSVRDPERWYESTRNTIYEITKITVGSRLSRVIFAFVRIFAPGVFKMSRMGNEIIWQGTFDGRFEDREYAMGIFNRHNEAVKRLVPPEKLLVYEVKEGWAPLCEFLGVEEPQEPFPRLNDTAELRQRIRGVKAISLAALALLTVTVFALLRRRAGKP